MVATTVSRCLQRAGVRKGDGDGTVPLVSLGLLSYKGWRTPKLNPENFSVTTHELLHRAVPYFRGLRCAHTRSLRCDLSRMRCIWANRGHPCPRERRCCSSRLQTIMFLKQQP